MHVTATEPERLARLRIAEQTARATPDRTTPDRAARSRARLPRVRRRRRGDGLPGA